MIFFLRPLGRPAPARRGDHPGRQPPRGHQETGVAHHPVLRPDGQPFHAGYGNDTSQPNLGDYIGAVAQGGNLFATWAQTAHLANFQDGQPTSSFTTPDFYFKKTNTNLAALRLGTRTFSDSGGRSCGGFWRILALRNKNATDRILPRFIRVPNILDLHTDPAPRAIC